MGFTCGFYKFNRSFLEKPAVLAQREFEIYMLVEHYMQAKHYNWNEEAETCVKKIEEKTSDLDMSAEDIIARVCAHNPKLDASNPLEYVDDSEFDTWCSDGLAFHEDIMNLLSGEDVYSKVITKYDMLKLCAYALSTFDENYKLEPVLLNRSFINKQDENDEDYSIYRDTDGVEVLFEDDMKKDVYKTDCIDDSELYASKHYFDSYNYNAMYRLVRCLVKMSCKIDWETELAFYCGGW